MIECYSEFLSSCFTNSLGRFLGKQIVLMLNHFVDTGVWDMKILHDNFQYDRWLLSNRHIQVILDFHSKDHLVHKLNTFVVNTIEKFLKVELDAKTMLFARKRQFNQLRSMKNKKSKDLLFKLVPAVLKKLDNLLQRWLTFYLLVYLTKTWIAEKAVWWSLFLCI